MDGVNTINQCGLKFDKKYNQWLNDTVFFDYYTRLKELAINRFEWINLPPTCDPRFLELILFEFGYALFFQHNINKAFLTLQCTIGGRFNLYRVPIDRRAYAVNGFQQECNDLDSVIIFNNYLRMPTSLTIELFAQRLTEIERTIACNTKAHKTPVLLLGSEKQQRTLETLYKKYDSGYPVIFGDKDQVSMDTLKAVKTDAPMILKELYEAKATIWNEAMTFLGINNANTDKRERLITNEVDANNELISMNAYTQLNARKQACYYINELFDLDVDVRLRKMAVIEGGVKIEQTDNYSSLYSGEQDRTE